MVQSSELLDACLRPEAYVPAYLSRSFPKFHLISPPFREDDFGRVRLRASGALGPGDLWTVRMLPQFGG